MGVLVARSRQLVRGQRVKHKGIVGVGGMRQLDFTWFRECPGDCGLACHGEVVPLCRSRVLSHAKSLISQDLAPLEGAGERKPETRGGCENLHASGWAFLAPQRVTYPAVKSKREILRSDSPDRIAAGPQALQVLAQFALNMVHVEVLRPG